MNATPIPVLPEFIAVVPARVAGIPCLIGVSSWDDYVPGNAYGPPEACYEDDGGAGEWCVLDRRGRPAPWLERKMTSRDEEAVAEALFQHFERGCRG